MWIFEKSSWIDSHADNGEKISIKEDQSYRENKNYYYIGGPKKIIFILI